VVGSNSILALFLCLVGNIGSSVGFKALATRAVPELSWENALRIGLSPWGWLGIAGGLCFLSGYILLLRTVPVSAAYPMVVATGTIGITLTGILLLGERLPLIAMVGIALIVTGVVFVAM
jgi:multidrug transporter EmrE-like cation transporter